MQAIVWRGPRDEGLRILPIAMWVIHPGSWSSSLSQAFRWVQLQLVSWLQPHEIPSQLNYFQQESPGNSPDLASHQSLSQKGVELQHLEETRLGLPLPKVIPLYSTGLLNPQRPTRKWVVVSPCRMTGSALLGSLTSLCTDSVCKLGNWTITAKLVPCLSYIIKSIHLFILSLSLLCNYWATHY